LRVLIAKQAEFNWVIKLKSSANKVGFDILLITAGKSLIYSRKTNGQRIDP
jgi:hypothetical protein